MFDGRESPRSWETVSGWNTTDQKVAVAVVAPRNCGKTAYVAALRHLSTGACTIIDGAGYRLGRMIGEGATALDAAAHVEDVYRNLLNRSPSNSTPGWYTYHAPVEQLRAGVAVRRDFYILDSLGGELFPGTGSTPRPRDLDERQSLSQRLSECNLLDARQVLLVFVNDPPQQPGGLQYPVPSALSEYLEGVRFDRVIFYVACADTLFPRLGDLRDQLERYNCDVDSPAAFRRYLMHFRGSPHCEFTLHFIQYLFHAGLIRTGAPQDASIGFFWGSSFGIERRTGRANVEVGAGPALLRDAEDWLPVQVIEPLLWSADLMVKNRGEYHEHRTS